ncbi:beta-L-arabinofuranosidase domain-containing protein [Paenibacillus alkaliterrae]
MAWSPDSELEKLADETIDLLGRAQQADSYHPDQRWLNERDNHETYCAGHLIEAAVAYHETTGKIKLLDIACKLADHIDSVYGEEEGKLRGYPGHIQQKWFGCACCPPNIARLIASLGQYIYSQREQTAYVHQFIGSETKLEVLVRRRIRPCERTSGFCRSRVT